MSARISVQRVDGVGVIQLNRPPLNIIDLQMQDELCAAAADLDAASDVAAVVIHGGVIFAAGADVKEMAKMAAADVRDRPEGLQAGFNAVALISKPVVAAVTGFALGGGCELALCADVRFCALDAVLGQPEVTLGIMPGSGGTQRLPRIIGAGRAKELILTGRRVAPEEALRIGLVDRVVPKAQLLDEAMAWATHFVGGPAVALAAAKRAVDEGMSTDLESGLALERKYFAPLFDTNDRETGMRHFVDKCPGAARFEGR
jgi:enoyl-CoA hydratase/carnithine racemase